MKQKKQEYETEKAGIKQEYRKGGNIKMKTPGYIKLLNFMGIASTVLAILYGVYIMIHHLGLIDSLDFGAGAYYYADIPGFASLVNGSHYTSQTPMWVLIVLFLAWGYLMYRLWVWIERKPS